MKRASLSAFVSFEIQQSIKIVCVQHWQGKLECLSILCLAIKVVFLALIAALQWNELV